MVMEEEFQICHESECDDIATSFIDFPAILAPVAVCEIHRFPLVCLKKQIVDLKECIEAYNLDCSQRWLGECWIQYSINLKILLYLNKHLQSVLEKLQECLDDTWYDQEDLTDFIENNDYNISRLMICINRFS